MPFDAVRKDLAATIIYRALSTDESGMTRLPKGGLRDLAPGVALRLRALMDDMELNVRQFAEFIGNGCERSAVNNWINMYNLPPVDMMVYLCERTGVTLDWIYTGDQSAMPNDKNIRFQMRLAGMQVPTLPPEPEPIVDYAPAPKSRRLPPTPVPAQGKAQAMATAARGMSGKAGSGRRR